MLIIWIIVSLIVFSIVVVIHEYWHYKVAKFFNIHIEEFWLGIPPRAKKLWKNKDGTLFSLNWIPLWGFVKISGESDISFDYFNSKKKLLSLNKLEDNLKKHTGIYDSQWKKISQAERKYLKEKIKNYYPWKNFFEKNIFQKSAVLVAGVVMNFILAVWIFTVLFVIGVKPVGINTIIPGENSSLLIPTLEQSIEKWIILEKPWAVLFPIENSQAEKAGVRQEDILLRINDTWFSSLKELQVYIWDRPNTDLKLYIERKRACTPEDINKVSCPIIEYVEINATTNSDWKLGTYLAPNYVLNHDFTYNYGFWESLKNWFLETYAQIRLTLNGLLLLWKNIFSPETPEDREEALEQVSWPIGIVWLIIDSIAWGTILILVITAIISVNLWVFNLLPIPALDGWRLLLLWIRSWIDMIFWKNWISEKLENMTHIIFFLLLIALSIVIAYNDIIKIISE